jgi:two-component system cell cycle sensor histidine kinase/response regulator CckA
MQSPDETSNNSVDILIAEDSPTQAEHLRHLLEKRGFQVRGAANGRQALALARERRPTLVVTDIVMPEMDGFTLCKEIKAYEGTKAVPVILVTELSSADDVIRGLECGADSFVRKPYDGRYLLSRIDYALANRRLGERTKMQLGVEITFQGRKYFITSERQQILDLLISTYEDAVYMNEELRTKQEELSHSYKSLRTLHRIAGALNQCTNEHQVLETALERALELPGVQAGWIFLRDGEAGLRLAATQNLPPALQMPGALEEDCLCRRKLLAGQLDCVANILECERLRMATGDTRGLRCHASVALRMGDQAVGVMNLAGPRQGIFADGDLETLHGVGNQVAVALERARLYEHLEDKVEERTRLLQAEIAERKRAEAALRLSEERFRKVFEEGPIGISLVSPDHRIIRPNRALCRMLDYAPEELMGLATSAVTHPEDVEKDLSDARRLFAGEIPSYQMEKRLLRKSGEAVWVNMTASLIRGEEGEPLFGIRIDEDLTRRKELEVQLRQAVKMEAIGRLAGGVAHDFNNLLTIIIGHGELLLEQHSEDDSTHSGLLEIKRAGDRAAALTRQLLTFARRQVMVPQVMDLNMTVAEMDKMLRRLIGEDIDLVTALDPMLSRVKADPAQIEQVLMNLAVNARDAMPRGGKLTIETANVELDETYTRNHVAVKAGPYVMLAVSDTGHGMDAETLTRAFEPFFTTKELGKGSGLGLATVYGIVQQSGGYIWAYSEPERGTSFKVYLPRVDDGEKDLKGGLSRTELPCGRWYGRSSKPPGTRFWRPRTLNTPS